MATSVAIQAVVTPPAQNKPGVNHAGIDANTNSVATGKAEKKAFNKLMDNTLKRNEKSKEKQNDSGNILPQADKPIDKTVKNDRTSASRKISEAEQKKVKANSLQAMKTLTHGDVQKATTHKSITDETEKIILQEKLQSLKKAKKSLNDQAVAGSVAVPASINHDFKLLEKLKGKHLSRVKNKTDAQSLKLAGLEPHLPKTSPLMQQDGKPLTGFSLTDMKATGSVFLKEMGNGQLDHKLQPGSILSKLDNLTTLTGTEQRAHMAPLLLPLSPATGGGTANASALYQSVLQHTFGQPGWDQSMGKQVVWMANQNIRSAELRLNPANLGSIDVRIEMKDDGINVAFSSQHMTVRHAIEQSLPRLREMMAAQGLNLNGADISQQSFSQHQDNSFTQHESRANQLSSISGVNHKSGLEQPNILMQKVKMVNGAVDYYI